MPPSESEDLAEPPSASLTKKWELTTGGDVSATPAVDGQRVYVPDWAGNLYAVDRATGAVVWQKKVADLTGVPGDLARATPAFTDTALVLGNQGPLRRWRRGRGGRQGHGRPALAHAGGESRGRDHHAVRDDLRRRRLCRDLVAGGGPCGLRPACCTFRGSVVALDLATGAILWKTYMTPDEDYPGNAVWGSSPAIDTKRGSLYIATGNNYDAPDAALAVHR